MRVQLVAAVLSLHYLSSSSSSSVVVVVVVAKTEHEFNPTVPTSMRNDDMMINVMHHEPISYLYFSSKVLLVVAYFFVKNRQKSKIVKNPKVSNRVPGRD